jgi:hypothetical protein
MDKQYSLENLRDIMVPEPPALWPPAPGVWWILAIVGLTLAILLYQLRQARKRNAYRHEGLAMLDGISNVHEISVILKRVALAAYPREQVASLYGAEWADFLRETCAQKDFSPLVKAEPASPATHDLKKLAAFWIGRHRAPGPTEGT